MDYRVRTGKYIGDIQVVTHEVREDSAKKAKTETARLKQSYFYKTIVGVLEKIWSQLLKIPFFEYTVSMFIDAVKIVIKYYAEIFIMFAITFPSAILLLNLFYSAIIQFFIFTPLILLGNLYVVSALYIMIYLREKGEKISFWKALSRIKNSFFAVSKLFIFQTMLFLLSAISFSILALFFRFFFEAIAISWSDAFIYWFFVLFIGLCTMLGALILSVIVHQTYFIQLFEKKNLDDAMRYSLHFTRSYLLQFFLYYLSFYLLFVIIFFWSGLYYLYLGMTIVIFTIIHASLFLGFLLRRKFYTKLSTPNIDYTMPTKQLFGIIIFFGVINYIFTATIIVRQFNYITGVFETQRDNYFLTKEMMNYTNTIYKFSIEYPQNWNIYERHNSSVTFYNNYTGTTTGAIWLNISVTPYSERDFLRLYNAHPGLVSLETTTKDVTTKVSNITVQDTPGVNYTIFKVKEPYPEYQTHYLLHKENYVYDIMFTTLDKDIEGNNIALFEKIAGSFRFIEE